MRHLPQIGHRYKKSQPILAVFLRFEIRLVIGCAGWGVTGQKLRAGFKIRLVSGPIEGGRDFTKSGIERRCSYVFYVFKDLLHPLGQAHEFNLSELQVSPHFSHIRITQFSNSSTLRFNAPSSAN